MPFCFSFVYTRIHKRITYLQNIENRFHIIAPLNITTIKEMTIRRAFLFCVSVHSLLFGIVLGNDMHVQYQNGNELM